tara:strand:- start:6601 stop:8097 length:1497 start_codon:yes stop_codon:yes gene_type:complete
MSINKPSVFIGENDQDQLYFTQAKTGINTTDPSEKLEVLGNIKADFFIGNGSLLTGIGGGGINLIPLDNTWTGYNSFTGIESLAIPNNGSGTAIPTSAILNTATQTITGAGDAVLGQILPAMIKDSGVYNLDRSNINGSGSLFFAAPTINISGPPAFLGVAGGYSVLNSEAVINTSDSSTKTMSNFVIKLANTYTNTGGGSFSPGEIGLQTAPILEANVTANNMVGAVFGSPVLQNGATMLKNIGVQVSNRVGGTDANVAYQYGTNLPSDNDVYCFYSAGFPPKFHTGGSGYFGGTVEVNGSFDAKGNAEVALDLSVIGALRSSGAGTGSFKAGDNAGLFNQGAYAVAIGRNAGNTDQNERSTAIGINAGNDTQGISCIAIGDFSGETNQNNSAVSIGQLSGNSNQGTSSIAIGRQSGETDQGENGIIINATGSALDDTTFGHIHIASDEGSIDFTVSSSWTVTDGGVTEVIFTKEALQTVVAASADFADFKTKVAAL